MTQLRRAILVLSVFLLAALPAAAQVDTGSADFTRFVALGDSLSHGFTNGGVVRGVQVNSIPALIARQAGVTDFEQALISAPGIPPLLVIQSLAPPVIVPRPGAGAPLNLNLPRPYNNLAISGFDVRDVLVTRTGNPLIDITLRGLGTALELAAVQQPTFVSLWIGNNDVLGAATSGIVIDGVTLTPAAQFRADLTAIVNTLGGVGADLVMANIPDVTGIPFVSTIPPVVVNPQTQQPVLGPDGQPIPLIGPNGPLNPATDRVLLTATAELARGLGIPPALGGQGPLSDSSVLSGNEIARIRERTQALNAIIRDVANASGAAFFDANAFFAEVSANGFNVGGIELTTDFLTGGIFSYDGVHPTPLGYAVIANGFIETINAHFGGDVPLVNLNPFLFDPAVGGAGAILPPGTPVRSTLFTEAAARSLKEGLRVPQPEELQGSEPRPILPKRGSGLSPDHPIFERPVN